MGWLYIFIASIFEISWAVGLKYSQGLTQIKETIFTITTMLLSFYFLSLSVKYIPLGTAYAMWTGIGVLGTTIYGILFFEEPKDTIRIIFLLLIVIGIIGLRLTYKSNV